MFLLNRDFTRNGNYFILFELQKKKQAKGIVRLTLHLDSFNF